MGDSRKLLREGGEWDAAMRLVFGRSYLWLFGIYVAAFVALALGPLLFGVVAFRYAAVLLPIYGGFLLISQIRSGVALDSMWQAQYPRETWQYKVLLAWNTFAIVAFTVMAVFFVRSNL
jgi:hypothetical protein